MAFAGEDSSGILLVVTFSALFGHDSHVGVKVATTLLVPENELVDRLVRDRERSMCREVSRDLLWAPFLANVVADQAPLGLGEVSSASSATAPGSGIAVGDLCPVDPVMSIWIPVAFTTNGRTVPSDGPCDLGV